MGQQDGVTLFIMDGPNVDLAIAEIIGRKPTMHDRPQYDMLMAWLQDRARRNRRLHAFVYANLADSEEAQEKQRSWAHWLKRLGFKVILKPRTADDDHATALNAHERRNKSKRNHHCLQ